MILLVKSLLLVGVGGQGTILVSKILSEGLMEEGYDVKMAEIHGMSQRGGSVTTQIRFGEKVYSPTINECEADVLVSFEKLEAVRSISHLKKDGILIINEEEIMPLPVLTGADTYPEGIMGEIKEKIDNVYSIDTRTIAEDLGEARSQNIVLLGMAVKALGLENIDWKGNIKKFLPEKVHDVNIRAFERGYNS